KASSYSSATFAFTDSIDAGSCEIVWDTVNNLEFVVNNAVNLMTTNDTTDVIDNLEPATTYYAWVRSVCGVEYSQWVELGRFVTNCYPLDTLPLAENFDSYTEDVATSASPVSTYPNHAMPSCWKFINMSENTSTYPQAHITSLATYNPNGGNCLFFRSSNTTPIYAVLPKVSENIEDLQLSFSYRNESLTASNGTLAIGVMTNPNNPSTFIELESLPVINEYTRVDYPFFADTMTGNGYYIAFRYTGGSANNYYLAIDNVVVNIGPNCRTSQDLAVANISTNSADLSWVNGTADSYIIAYSTSEGFNPDTCSTVATSTTESVTLTGLIDYTKYYFAVKAVCSTDSGAWSQVETFKTTMECNGLNFVEPIIGNIASTTSNATYPFYSTSNTYPRGITWQLYTQEELEMQGVYSNNLIKAIAYQYTSTTDMDAPLNIYMAEVDTNQIGVPDTLALSSMTLVFSGRHIFTNDDEWSVIELTNPYSYSGSRNLMVAVERDSAVNTAGNFVYTAGPTGVYRCVYSYTNTSGTKSATRTVNRSNIRFSICTEVPACERPDSVVVSNIQPTQVHVSWVGNATTYDVAYGLTGFNIDSTSSYQVVSGITSDSITLTNLIDGGIYDVYVRGNCTSPVATSEWSYKVRFTTPCFPQSVPYIEDFDSYTIDVSQSGAVTPTAYPDHRRPDCWSLLNLSSTTTTYPQAFLSANSSYAQSGNCLFFRSSSSTPIYAVLPKLNANIDTLQILFSYRNEGVTAGNHTITLGVMTNPDDTSTFIPLESYAKTTTITAVEHLFGFDTVSGNNYHIAFRYSGGTSNNMWAAIDSIVIDYMPSCPKPIYLEANNLTETTAELSWTGIATSWIVEYGLAGFELGTGTTLTSNTNSLTLTGLTHSTRYDYYVRGICNVNDTSDWALDPCTFRTECGIISTLPWSADLDGAWYYYPNNDNNARFPSCWSLVNGGSATYNWRNTTTATHIHTGSYAIYYYGTSSSSTEHDDWLITPEIQLTGNEQLTFWMKNPSTSNPSASYVYESRVAIYAYTVNANDTAININNFVQINPYIQIAPGINEYSEYIIPLTGLTGNVHLAFVVDTASYTFYIDDITIEAMPACPKPRFIVADSISQTAVELSWQSTSTDFIVDYKPIYDTVWTSVTGIYSNTTVVAGLNPSTTYQFRVRAVCTAVDTSEWSNVAEFTTLCGAVSLPFFEDFSGTTFPANCWERLSGYPFEGASITSTTSGWNRYTANNYGLPVPHAKVNIYGTTCKYWLVTPEIDLASTPGIELTFDLALTKYNNSIAPDSVGPDDKFMVIISTDGGNTWLQSNATIWGDDSTADYSLRNVSNTGQRVSISLDQYFGDTIRIAFYGESRVSGGDNDLRIDNISVHASCPSPIISSVTPEATTATVTWTSDETSFQVSYKEMTASEWNTEIDVDGVNSYTFTGLLPETAYQFRVRSICDVDEYSMWTVGTFTTPVLPCMAPTNITASEITDRTATIAWDGMENQLSWEVRYVTQGQDTTVVATTNPVVITNLFYGQTYQVWIRAFCGADTYSDWSEVATFNTLSCSPISNLVVAEVNSNNATIVWAAEEGQTQWEVSYGIEGFTEGNGNEIIVSEIPTYQITELESGINYDVYVRAICGEGFYSAWSSRVTFTTTVGINTAQTNNLNATLYPNPATKEATISVEGVSGKVEIIVTDINGRTLLQEETTSEGLLDKTINVEHWTRGTYFVRVVNNDAVAVQKLIVK
ncbi:MAG: fibronectin type III domain-containing protein, partial [Bacteroidales bacterium]|nr:fibronectin type III domain-containing protein [Bacteroidales bacterium]